MRVNILYFNGCPNHFPVVDSVRRIVVEHGLDAEVEEVEVAPDDVERLRFLGSPTVQIDGVDIEPAARDRTDYAMSCRVYDTADGLPSEQMLRAALGLNGSTTEARSGDGAGFAAIGGSLLTAVLSSACCWLPLLLLSFGASAAGASALFERWRPAFIIVAIAGLALGFYFAYLRKSGCAAGCCGTSPRRGRRLQRGLLWGSTVVVTVFIFFPSYVGLFLDGSDNPAAANTARLLNADAREYVFDVEGMHCGGCAATLQNELVKIDGVIDAHVDYTSRTATVHGTGTSLPDRVAEAASRAGFSIDLTSDDRFR